MSLQQALDDCLIDFDRRVLVTDLLEEYKLTYQKTQDVLEAHITKQEKSNLSNKYEKRFLVHGQQADGAGELYTIVQGEEKLKEWLHKLKDSQSQLYSVEFAGGSKNPAPSFKPMQQVEVPLAKLEQRAGAARKGVTNGVHKPTEISEKMEPSKTEPSSSIKVEEKTSPSEQKSKPKAGAAAVAKKGSIGSFFSAAPAAKAKEAKPAAVKPAASSMENFFKKQPTSQPANSQAKTTPTSSVKKEEPAASNSNVSIQLFDEQSEEASSDEEEKLDKLRRKVVGSGDESEDGKPTGRSKRRRIVDSDDEEQPQKKSAEPKEKQKVEEDEAMEVEAATNETFLDDDGFVITVKAKKPLPPTKKKTSPTATAAAGKSATATATTKKKSPPAAGKGAKETPKSKQGNIMSFFTKK